MSANQTPIDLRQVRGLVQQTRDIHDDLVASGVDRARLETKLEGIGKRLDEPHRDVGGLRSLLAELEGDLIRIENRLLTSGVLADLHQILGTGILSP